MTTRSCRGVLAVLVLAGCGAAATDVTVAGQAPTTATAPPTTGRPTARTLLPTITSTVAPTTTITPGRTTTTASYPSRRVLTGNDAADFDAIGQLGLVLDAADYQGYGDLASANLPGLTVVAGDARSTGPTVVSVAVGEASDATQFGVAVRSASGTCLWYAQVDSVEYLGTGQSCTGDSAVGSRHVLAPADSPWRLVLSDTTISKMQARPAQSALEFSLSAIRAYHYGDSAFSHVTAEALHAEQPSVDFVAVDPSTAPRTVSFAVDGERFGAAALADDGTCYWITQDFVTPALGRGHGDPCTGAAALAAVGLDF